MILNILVLTPLVPYPPHDGDKLRLYYFLKHLKSRGHKIDLFCLTRVKGDLQHAEQLRPLCRSLYVEHITNWDLLFNLIGGMLMGSSLNVASHFSPKHRDTLQAYWVSKTGQSIDVVLAHRLRMAPEAFRYNPGKPVVLDLTDSLISYTRQMKKQSGAPWLRRVAAWWDFWLLRKEEVDWSRMAAQAVTIAQPDADILTSHGLDADQITVIPNGVDLSAKLKKGKPVGFPAGGKVVCFVGNMGYAPNEEGALWFIQVVWPRVKAAVPDAVFMAVGGTPRKILKRYHNGTDLLVTGWVPEVEPYLTSAGVSIAPLRFAGGMQNKVALSMGLGVPVVATSAATGWLPDAGKKLVRVADDAETFADRVIEVLKNPKKARTQAAKGKKFVAKNYQRKTAGRKLEKVLKQASR
jgi:glycosyltransferase involved in cell wall biosynthesis